MAMSKLNVALVDDEPASLKTLQLLLKRYFSDIEVIASFSNPTQALKELPDLPVDLLFLDIEMPVMTGFDLLSQLTGYKGGVIFATAHSSYAIRAFKFSAVDYLLKPIETEDLKQAIEKFIRNRQAKPDNSSIRQLADNLEHLSQPIPKKIVLTVGNNTEVIQINDIEYIQADRNYVLVKRVNKSDLTIIKSLKSFEDILPPSLFVRIHVSYIVNIEMVERYLKSEGTVVMQSGAKLPLSRSYRDIFVARLKG